MKVKFIDSLLAFDKDSAWEIILDQWNQENNPEDIYRLVSRSLAIIGEQWANGEVSLAQEYMSSRICEELIDKLLPSENLQQTDSPHVAITTLNDYHLFGKKILCSVVKSSGIKVTEYKPTSDLTDIVDNIIKDDLHIIMVSALMLHTALKVKVFRKEFELRNFSVKIMVGGAPFNFDNQLWKMQEADAMGLQPSDAILQINQWTGRI